MSIILFFIVLGVLVVSHEFGHFFVAKLSGMKVEEFGFGFPPRMFGKKIGETVYSFNWIPFGGFVRILGEDPAGGGQVELKAEEMPVEVSKAPGSFAAAPRWQQAAVVLAGVVFNFLLAWMLITGGYIFGLPTPAGEVPPGASAENVRLLVTDISKDSPAEKAGLRIGDELVSLSGAAATTPEEVRAQIQKSGSQPVSFEYKRGGELETVSITPVEGLVPGGVAVGISMERIGLVRLPFFRAIVEGFMTTVGIAIGTVLALVGLVQGLFGGAGAVGVTGPVGIVGLVGNASVLGFAYLISLVAVISINLAVMNLIPFPALDGGRLAFIIVEAIRGKEIPPRVAQSVNAAGFFLLLFLMAILTYGDIMRLVRG